MSTHSVAEATRELPSLIDRALKGESVMISLGGRPVVELRALPSAPGPSARAALEWLDAHRVGKAHASLDAAALVRQMRDEGP